MSHTASAIELGQSHRFWKPKNEKSETIKETIGVAPVHQRRHR